RQRLPARPCKGPERRRQAYLAELPLRFLPQRRRLVGEPERNLRRERRGAEARLRANEGGPVERWRIVHGIGARIQARPSGVAPRGLYSAATKPGQPRRAISAKIGAISPAS